MLPMNTETVVPGLVVVALGDRALCRRGEPLDAGVDHMNIKIAAEAIAEIATEHRVVVIHGNGPQLGLVAPFGATRNGDPVGGFLDNELAQRLPAERLASLVTLVVVDPDDPAFAEPTAFVGPAYDARDARFIAHERGWRVAPDGAVWRRVVPMPQPMDIVELNAIRILVDHGVVVTCNGGGGIPVVPDGPGGLHEVEAMVEPDLSAALLATALGADALMLLTDVDAVFAGWGTQRQHAMRAATPAELRSLELPTGSMGTKVEAACRFVEAGGRIACIGPVGHATEVLRGDAGTIVRRARLTSSVPTTPGSSRTARRRAS